MNAPSSTGKENEGNPVPPARIQQELPRAEILARLNQELRVSLNAVIEVTKQIELQHEEQLADELSRTPVDPNDSTNAVSSGVVQSDNGQPAPAAPAISKCDVLHIEDNSNSFASIKLLLGSKRKLKVERAINGETGVALARTLAPGLILLDLDLPDIHGSEVLQRLQKDSATAGIPVVIISGDTTPSQIERLLILGARNYLTKPFNPQVFLAVVDGILEEAGHAIEARRTDSLAPTAPAAPDVPCLVTEELPYFPQEKTRSVRDGLRTGAA